MTLRKITIGRSPYSDIFFDGRFIYASSNHGEIYSDGNQLIYRDMSTNGTLVNRTFVKHRCVSVSRGDIILIAGRYLLDWNQIDMLLPAKEYNTVSACPCAVSSLLTQKSVKYDVSDQWNWGAMGLYPFWGLSNGCPWAVYVALLAWYLFPLPNLFFGYYGNKLSLHSRYWFTTQEFQHEQKRWKSKGIVAMSVFSAIFLLWLGIYVKYLISQ